jgi:putative transposase
LTPAIPWRLPYGRFASKSVPDGFVATPAPSTDSGQVWEQVIRDDEDYAAHVDYCHINPVKHGYV